MTTWTNALTSFAWPTHLVIPNPGAQVSEWESAVCEIFPGLAQSLSATPQDPIHHAEGDVWTHTKMVVSELLADPQYAQLPTALKGVSFYAALLHDISKPQTTRKDNGRIIAPGHSAKGAVATRRELWKQAVPFYIREQVCRLIEVHQVPFFAFSNKKGIPAEYTARVLSCDRSIDLLCLLARADMKGRICQDQQKVLDDIELFREQATELGCLDKPYSFPDAATRMAYIRSQGNRYPDEPVYQSAPFEVILMSGLPASGKNTWVAENSHLPVISYDDIRDELGFKHGQGTGSIVHLANDRMREHLRSRQPFIVNATHLSKQMRSRTLELIASYGGQVRVVYCEAPFEDLLSRNSSRDTSLPNTKILDMTSRWEVPGLDEVDFIQLHVIDPNPKKGKIMETPTDQKTYKLDVPGKVRPS